MEEDEYNEDTYGYSEPPPQSTTATQAELCVKQMLTKQLDTDVTLEQQVAKGRTFTTSTLTFLPFVEQASGQLSLAEFQALEQEHQNLDGLRGSGLTDEEIALKLEQEGKQLPCRLLQIHPYKRGRFVADPVFRQQRLKEIEEKIKRKKTLLSNATHEDVPPHDSRRQAGDLEYSMPASSRWPAQDGKRYIHPDDPINHLDVIAARLFKKTPTSKDVNFTPPKKPGKSRGEEPIGESGRGRHEDTKEGILVPAKEPFNEKHADSPKEGLKPEGTLTSPGDQDSSALKRGRTDSLTTQTSDNPHKETSPEDKAKTTKSDQARGQSGTKEKSLVLTNVSGELKDEGHDGGNNSPRQLSSIMKPLSRDELLKKCLSVDDICKIDRFRNYSPGQPSKVLYLKNMSSKITEADLASIFLTFQLADKPKIIFKLLKGKMRGQAFVTFPDVETASCAMGHVNGYPLGGKPVIIHYGKQR